LQIDFKSPGKRSRHSRVQPALSWMEEGKGKGEGCWGREEADLGTKKRPSKRSVFHLRTGNYLEIPRDKLLGGKKGEETTKGKERKEEYP